VPAFANPQIIAMPSRFPLQSFKWAKDRAHLKGFPLLSLTHLTGSKTQNETHLSSKKKKEK
ncbi:MAG: hypothetical protein ACK5IJ_00790, partial [Mangrovibacterium sp.]